MSIVTRFGVEPICRALQSPRRRTTPPSRGRRRRARVRDAVMIPVLVALWAANYRVYGARKLWKAARRAGHDVGRDQVARLMRALGIEGCPTWPPVRTTRPDEHAARHPDLVDRDFTATAPNQLWVTDLTFVADLVRGGLRVLHRRRVLSDDRRLAGRRAHAHRMVLDAVDMASWSRGARIVGLRLPLRRRQPVHQSFRYGERLAELGAQPSIGTVGDAMTTRWPRRSTASTRPS